MSERTHDTFPIMLEGRRRAYLVLPVDLTCRDAEQIIKQVKFVVECTKDHAIHDHPMKPKGHKKP